MQRSKTLKVSITPDTSIFPESHNTLLFETPKPIRTAFKRTIEESLPEKSIIKATSDTLGMVKKYAIQIILIAFMIYYYKPNLLELNNKIISIEESNNLLKNEINLLRQKLENIRNSKEISTEMINISSIQNGGNIIYNHTSSQYRYGFFNRKSSCDASQVLLPLNSPGNCFAFSGSVGSLGIRIPGKFRAKYIKIYHPITSDRNSSIKEFEVYNLNDDMTKMGEFMYEISKPAIQAFYFEKEFVVEEILIKILSNHGKRKYTAIYNIEVFGEEM